MLWFGGTIFRWIAAGSSRKGNESKFSHQG
jgi:hypothetical protein